MWFLRQETLIMTINDRQMTIRYLSVKLFIGNNIKGIKIAHNFFVTFFQKAVCWREILCDE